MVTDIQEGITMPRLTIDVPEDLMKEFRIRIIELYSTEKGAVTKAMLEAIRLWLKQRAAPPKKK